MTDSLWRKRQEPEALKLALDAHHKNERHNSVAETNYWCNQYKLLAHQAIQALAKQEQGEPVAVRQSNGEIYVLGSALVPIGAYLYTTPQQRTWVGLTGKDYNEIFEKARSGEHAVQLAEAKLKEKNT